MSTRTKKEPLFHISRRGSMRTRQSVLLRFISVLIAFMICSIILAIYKGYSPINFIGTLFSGTIGDSFNIWIFLGDCAILLGLGLALIPAFKMKFWNIGADGQALMGGMVCYMVLYFGCERGNLPGGLGLVLGLVAAIIAGAIWGVIPAIFKAIWNTNETLFTLMMNYIAIQLCLFLKNYIVFTIQKGNKTTIPIPEAGTLASPFDIEQFLPVLFIAIIAVIITIYIKKTKQGYELSLVGDSENSAKYAGINVKWAIIRTMIISGAICGFVGWLMIVGSHQAVDSGMTNNNGFTAIIVAWLAKFNPLYMVLTAGLVAFLRIGMKDVTANAGITSDGITNIFIGIFFFFIIAFEFFITYKIILRKNDEGEIDNKFFRFMHNKIYLPLSKFNNKIIDAIKNFFSKCFNKVFKKKNKELALETNSADAVNVIAEEPKETDNVESLEEEKDEEVDL